MKKTYYLFFIVGILIGGMTGCQKASSDYSRENTAVHNAQNDTKVKEQGEESAQVNSAETDTPNIGMPQKEESNQIQVQDKDASNPEKVNTSSVTEKSSVTDKKNNLVSNTVQTQSKASLDDNAKENNIDQKEQQKTVTNDVDEKDESEQQENVKVAVYGDSETILASTEIKLTEGMTAFDALKQILKDNNIQMEYSGKGKAIYIEGINNLYEFDKGPGSGWIFHVNGNCPSESCSAYVLQKGDEVNWYYTLDFGKDIG